MNINDDLKKNIMFGILTILFFVVFLIFLSQSCNRNNKRQICEIYCSELYQLSKNECYFVCKETYEQEKITREMKRNSFKKLSNRRK